MIFLSFLSLFVTCYASLYSDNENFVTIRMNTFRRNELLFRSLKHYLTCPQVRQIVVVWSDQELKPPFKLLEQLQVKDMDKSDSRIYFEIHSTDSLNNRFLELVPAKDDVSK